MFNYSENSINQGDSVYILYTSLLIVIQQQRYSNIPIRAVNQYLRYSTYSCPNENFQQFNTQCVVHERWLPYNSFTESYVSNTINRPNSLLHSYVYTHVCVTIAYQVVGFRKRSNELTSICDATREKNEYPSAYSLCYFWHAMFHYRKTTQMHFIFWRCLLFYLCWCCRSRLCSIFSIGRLLTRHARFVRYLTCSTEMLLGISANTNQLHDRGQLRTYNITKAINIHANTACCVVYIFFLVWYI